jgi:hypothetical protein
MAIWRGLATAILIAMAAAAPAQAFCALDQAPFAGRSQVYQGVVRGPASPEEVRQQTAIAIAKTGAILSPAYANLPRIFAFYEDPTGGRHGTIAAVVDGRMPQPGERVRLASRRRDPSQPCAFIPWTVVGASVAEAPAEAPGTFTVPIVRRGNNYFVPVTLNGSLTLEFTVDSGASGVVVPANIIEALQRGGTLGAGDVIGKTVATLADGSKSPASVVRLKSVTVGGKTLLNVVAMGGPPGSSLLLGQTFLGRFKSWSIDNARSVLVLKL